MKGALVVGDVEATLGGASGGGGSGEGPSGDGSSSDGSGGEPPDDATGVEAIRDWLDGTDNYDGVVDARGESEVTVDVGADGNGGDFAFAPAAVHVDPGTTVVWEWVGGAEYDVRDAELGYHSDLASGTGHRFAVEFGGDGLSTYECSSYGEQGMRGVVLVGEGPVPELSRAGVAAFGGVGALVGVPLAYGLREHVRDTTRPPVE